MKAIFIILFQLQIRNHVKTLTFVRFYSTTLIAFIIHYFYFQADTSLSTYFEIHQGLTHLIIYIIR
jgi:hypothetical protein